MTQAKWVVDPSHTLVEFSVRHMMFATVKGRFGTIDGAVFGNATDLAGAEIEMSLDAASVDTKEPNRDQHLRSADFFDVENHPKVLFRSAQVQPNGTNRYKLTGDLTIRGVTKQVEWDLDFNGHGKDPWGQERIGLSAETRINRKEFGLNWNAALEAGGFLVGDEVQIAVQMQAIKS